MQRRRRGARVRVCFGTAACCARVLIIERDVKGSRRQGGGGFCKSVCCEFVQYRTRIFFREKDMILTFVVGQQKRKEKGCAHVCMREQRERNKKISSA